MSVAFLSGILLGLNFDSLVLSVTNIMTKGFVEWGETVEVYDPRTW